MSQRSGRCLSAPIVASASGLRLACPRQIRSSPPAGNKTPTIKSQAVAVPGNVTARAVAGEECRALVGCSWKALQALGLGGSA